MIELAIRRIFCVLVTHDDRLVMRGGQIGRWCARCYLDLD